ncbi:MAG: 2'-5' RNA ligase family protein [Candidatus Peribacteraceae bacterium]|nr:2'-5' RNA ligase family protein [Candidatus Peribacteraceae bacterium]
MKNNLIGLAVLLDDFAFNFARKLEIDISKKFHTKKGLNQSPHITIKRPFECDDKMFSDVSEYVEKLSEETDPFSITIDGFDFFEPTVVYLNIKPSNELLELHKRINKDLLNKFSIEIGPREGENVVFHSTIALEDISEETFYKIKEYVLNIPFQHTFNLRKIGLFYKEDDYWIIAKKVTALR